MKPEIALFTRREFLHRSVLGAALAPTWPAFVARTLSALGAETKARATQVVTGADSPILVILQMAGGNDGLNTVVPFGNDFYLRARPRLALDATKVLKLNDELGVHPALTGFKELYDSGHLAIVQGVGYPNPNRSHFRSTEIWQTACDADRVASEGWLGRYFDHTCSGCDPTVAVSVGRQMPQALSAKTPIGVSLEAPRNYRFLDEDHPPDGQIGTMEKTFRELNQVFEGGAAAQTQTAEMENSGATIGALSGSARNAGSALDFLERTALDAQVSSDRIREIVGRDQGPTSYPVSRLGNSLKLVSRLIAGGLPTRVFYVSQGGYDTHTNQSNTQARLLKELGDAVQAFVADLKAQGNLSRVLLMTFSEFGRRVSENASGGTDHGAAAPVFLVGDRLNGGLLGRYPSLAPTDLFQGDLKHHVDFRSVYAGILETWLHTDSTTILRKKFEPLRFM